MTGRPVHRLRPSMLAAAALVAALMVTAACGQKAGVGDDPSAAGRTAAETTAPTTSAEAPAGGEEAPESPTSETSAPGGGPIPSNSTPPAAAPSTPSTAAGSTPRGSAAAPKPGSAARPGSPTPGAPARPAGSAGPDSGGSAPAAGAPAAAPAPSPNPPAPAAGPANRTGVTDTVIKVGIHAPITGAAPFPQNAFDKGKDVYWKFIADKGGVHGRIVQIAFRDDQFNPSRAVQVCREMVEQEKVFVLIGAAGSDQITACGRYADSVGVPYLSAGVNEDGLTGLKNYFAVSQTYAQQSPVIASMIKNKLGKTKVAIVVNNTPALNETQRSITAAVESAGLKVVRQSRIGKNASDSELLSEANQLRSSGAEVVYILTSPVNFIKLATNAYAQAFNPVWTGPGITNGINIVTEAGCPAIDGALMLSPFPQLDVIDSLDPDYRPAYAKYAGGEPDDIGLVEWGLNKVLHRMMEAAGRDLSRESFMAAMTSGRPFETNVFPVVSYDATIRFGAKTTHVLQADCESRRWKTAAQFVSGF